MKYSAFTDFYSVCHTASQFWNGLGSVLFLPSGWLQKCSRNVLLIRSVNVLTLGKNLDNYCDVSGIFVVKELQLQIELKRKGWANELLVSCR